VARLVDLGVTKVVWVPDSVGIAVLASPDASAELNAAGTKDLGPYLTTAYRVGMEDPDTVSEKSVTETANIQVPTVNKYSGMLELFRDFTTGAPTAGTDFTSFFAGANELGYIVRRIGLPSATAFAAGHKVEIYKFIADSPKFTGGTGSGYVKGTVKLLPQGVFALSATVVA
jgi:hypothetical protein